MFLLKIFYFLKGYVIIEITDGKMPDFINALIENDIVIWNITQNRFCMWECDFRRIRPAVRKSKARVKVIKRCGLKTSLKHRSCWFFILSFLVFASLLYMSSGYVWTVRIEGCDGETLVKVQQAAESIGIIPGARKSTLPTHNEMKDAILYNIKELNWAWVYLDGTCARISVRKNTTPPVVYDNGTPCNIKASREGYITYISAKQGKKLLSPGSWVKEGDVIISGVIPASEKYPMYTVAADGEVIAQTVYTESCEYPLYKSYTNDTGFSKTVYSLRLFELEIPLSYGRMTDFEEYRTQIIKPPVGICRKKYIETSTTKEEIPEDAAVWEAREALYERISKKLSKGAVKTDERVTYERVSEDRIKVTLVMDFNEDIGIKTNIEEWQMEEITDDKTD